MRPQELKKRIERLCTGHLGADMGPRVAALFRNGFELRPTGEDEEPSGRFRFGGPALLEPGTPWPTSEDGPLTLLAVLDTDALAPWLDVALPPGAGLLNIFYRGIGDSVEEDISRSFWPICFETPCDWRVVPAAPALAAESSAPSGTGTLPPRPVRAEPVVTLPEADLAFNSSPPHELIDAEVWDAFARLRDRLPEIPGEDDAFTRIRGLPEALMRDTPAGHRAFGWPWVLQEGPAPDNRRVHLLQLDTDDTWSWGDNGTISLDIPAEALRVGDFGQVDCYFACC
ncbi:DUF1963 domain-containing protein [Halostreptopolyspora alba]|uniref:DUF1963 domain-containing protein n=1 Tax=Halostreptopolyspora alba TaxID=2487137 RepID=A0A3N0EB23_9ACTN|nr:DUF1963 domain-containing protein [Nocardiopsaceae bacterium YIM 96095]